MRLLCLFVNETENPTLSSTFARKAVRLMFCGTLNRQMSSVEGTETLMIIMPSTGSQRWGSTCMGSVGDDGLSCCA